jgi:hypothetical protein
VSTHPLSSCIAARARPHHHDSRVIARSAQAGPLSRSRPRDLRVNPWRAARASALPKQNGDRLPANLDPRGWSSLFGEGPRRPASSISVVTHWSPPEMRTRRARTAVSARESGPHFRAPSAALSRVALGFARPEGRLSADLPREGKVTSYVPEMPSTNPNRPLGRPVPPGKPGGLSDRRVPLFSLCLGPLDAGILGSGLARRFALAHAGRSTLVCFSSTWLVRSGPRLRPCKGSSPPPWRRPETGSSRPAC